MTDAVLEEVGAWQNRPLEPVYAVVYFDALRVKIRAGLVRNRAVYLALGITCGDHKDVLGLWIEQSEGAKFWLRIMNELKARGRPRPPPQSWTVSKPAPGVNNSPPWCTVPAGAQNPVHNEFHREFAQPGPKAIRNKGHFPSDEAATKLIYLALRNITAKWRRPPKEWHAAKLQFAIQFGDRFVLAA